MRRRLVAHNGCRFVGGGELWTARLLLDLSRRGHDVLMLVRDSNVQRQIDALGVPTAVARIGGQAWLPGALGFARTLGRLRPDALLLTTFTKIWIGGMGAALARVPKVVVRIGLSTDLPRRRRTYRIALRRWTDAVVANASGIQRDLARDLPDLGPERIRLIFNGVRAPKPERAAGAVRRELGIGDGSPVVGCLTRLVVPKRLDRAVRAVATLDGVHLVIAGDGPQRGPVAALASGLGVQDRVHLLGHRTDVGDILGALDVYLVTSDQEGMSNGMLEAMACGVPVLTTPASGADDALEPLPDGSQPGRITEPEAGAIANELALLLADRARLKTMGACARERASERFDADARVDDWEELLFS